MAFDPLKEGATEVFDPAAEGATAVLRGEDGLEGNEISRSSEILESLLLDEKSADELMVSERGALASDVIRSFDMPDDSRARLNNSIILSHLFNADMDEVSLMQPAMIKAIYGEDLDAIQAEAKLREDTPLLMRATKRFASSVVGGFERLVNEGNLGKIDEDLEYLRLSQERVREFNNMSEEDFDKLSFKEINELPQPPRGDDQDILTDIMSMSREAERNVKERRFGSINKALSTAPAENAGEKLVDIGAGVAGFTAKIFLAKQIMGGTGITQDGAAFEVVSQLDGSKPGVGSLVALGLGGIHRLPSTSMVGKVGKLSAQGGLFAGITAVEGGSPEDIAISFLIPFALKATGAAKNLVGDAAVGKFFKAKFPDLKIFTNAEVAKAHRAAKDWQKVKKGSMSRDTWSQKHGKFAVDFAQRKTAAEKPVQQAAKAAEVITPKALAGETAAKAGIVRPPASPIEAAKVADAKVEAVEGEVEVGGGDIIDDATDKAVAITKKKFQKAGVLLSGTEQKPKAILKPSSRKGVKFEVSYFSPDGKPGGHDEFNNIDEAVLSFLEHSGGNLQFRPDLPDEIGITGVEKGTEFVYESKQRPVSLGTTPKEGFLRAEKGGKFGRAVFSRPLTEAEIEQFGLTPVSFSQPTPKAKPAKADIVADKKAALDKAKKLPTKAEPVKPVLPTKIVTPGQAGPFKVTFKATEGLEGTRIVVDPKVGRSIQSGETKIAALKTKLKQAKADKKVAIVKSVTQQIAKAELSIAKLKLKQEVKLTDTIASGKAKVIKLKQATKFRDSLRRDAISMIRAIPKDMQKDFILRASNVTTVNGINKLGDEIQKGLDRAEKKESITKLKAAAKAIKPAKMLPEFGETAKTILDSFQIGKINPDTVLKNNELKAMAKQVLAQAKPDSVAAVRAEAFLEDLNKKTGKTIAVNQLGIDAIDQITDTLIALKFQNDADTIAARDENATEAVRRRDEIKKSVVEVPPDPNIAVSAKNKFRELHSNLESALDDVAGGRAGTYDLWKDNKSATTKYIYDVLDAGVDEQVIHNEEARRIVREILKDNDVSSDEILEWSMRSEDISTVKKAFGLAVKPDVHSFTLKNAKGEAQEFEFTANELMSIFMHTRNSHNLNVLLEDGMDRFTKGKKEKIRGFNIELVDEIIDTLSTKQKKVARQVGSKLMDGYNKESLNATSEAIEFFPIATVDNYWPARRSIIRGPKGKKLSGMAKSIEGLGLLKERVGEGNPLRLSGFFETVHAVNKDVSSYVGLAEPLREVKSVYTPDVIAEMEDAGRGREAKVINELIERFEDQSTLTGPLEDTVKKMIGGFAKSKLFLNPKIAPRQWLSTGLISAYVDPKYMTEFRGKPSKALAEEIRDLSPQLAARADGLQFDRDVGDAFIENELMHYLTNEIGLIDKTGMGIKFYDTLAIQDIYRAVKAEVTDKNQVLDINSSEGQALLKDRFEWVVRHTQPMWQPKDRSLTGSSPNPLVRIFTMFMSQREQLVRMSMNAESDWANSEKTPEDAQRAGRAYGAVALNMALFTLYNAAWAALVKKRDVDFKGIAKNFLKDLLSLPFGGKYIAKSFEIIYDRLQDRPVFREDFDKTAPEAVLRELLLVAAPNFALAGKHFVTKEKYRGGDLRGEEKWKNELMVATDALADAWASLKGIPYHGAKDIVDTFKVHLEDEDKKRSPRRTNRKR